PSAPLFPYTTLFRSPILIGGGGEKVTLRLVAQHADIWHSFGDVETMRHKASVLDDWCGQVGRDPKEIERSTTFRGGSLAGADEYVELGFTHFIVSADGPRYDLGFLREALAWRDEQRRAA